jgi:DNA-directed RNA polymerase specialized sigma24 family protein
MREPLAVELYRRYLGGATVKQISADLGISAERVQRRIDVAAAYLKRGNGRA